jgi:hypothetical protein
MTITEEQLLPFTKEGKPNPKALPKDDRLKVMIVPKAPDLTRDEADALWKEVLESKEGPDVG